MTLGRWVLVTQPNEQGAHPPPEEHLLVLDEVASAQVPDQRPRGHGMAQIKRDWEADHPDADHLERVGRPPRGIHGREVKQPVLRPDQPDDANAHDEVRIPPGQQIGSRGAPGEKHEPNGAGGEDQVRRRGRRGRDGRNLPREHERGRADARQSHHHHSLDSQQDLDIERPAQHRQRRGSEDRAADRQVQRSGDLNNAVGPQERTGRGQRMNEQHRRDDRERHPGPHSAAVVAARADDRHGRGNNRGSEAGGSHDDDVDDRDEHDHLRSRDGQQ